MAQLEFEDRKDMSEDLRVSGFDTPQARSILRVVEGMVRNLPTRADWKRSEENNRKMHEEAAENNKKFQAEVDQKLQQMQQSIQQTQQSIQKMQYTIQQMQQSIQQMQQSIQNIFLWLRWGITIFISMFLAVVSAGALRGWFD